MQNYSLLFNFLNQQKLEKLFPNYEFSKDNISDSSAKSSSEKLRSYQLEDVNFLSKLESVAIFSEMRTGKTPIALMTFGN